MVPSYAVTNCDCIELSPKAGPSTQNGLSVSMESQDRTASLSVTGQNIPSSMGWQTTTSPKGVAKTETADGEQNVHRAY
ncbi:MAG: hypothetical protein IJ172_02445 [Ruminococcus sp.]|nr:hypothetical protein [Ruminococcus sp.]